MQHVLYAPGLAITPPGARKLGAEGDFTTTNHRNDAAFGQARCTRRGDPPRQRRAHRARVGGSGVARRPARSSRRALPHPRGELRICAGGQRTIAPAVCVARRVARSPPTRVEGVVLMNEVFRCRAAARDRMTRRRVVRTRRGVDGELCWSDRPLQEGAVQGFATARFPATGDHTSEINWPPRRAGAPGGDKSARRVALVVTDYGFPRAEYYHPQRLAARSWATIAIVRTTDPFLWACLPTSPGTTNGETVEASAWPAGFAWRLTRRSPRSSAASSRTWRMGGFHRRPTCAKRVAVQRLPSSAEMGNCSR